MKNSKTLYIVGLIVAICLSLGGGYLLGKGQSYGGNSRFNGAGMAGGIGANGRTGGNRLAGGSATFGQIVSIDEQGLSVKMPNGSSKIILLAPSTKIVKTVEAVKDDLKTGVNVMAQGTANADGSITASSVQIQTDAVVQNIIPGTQNNSAAQSGSSAGQNNPAAQSGSSAGQNNPPAGSQG
jgi:hypothetical protein